MAVRLFAPGLAHARSFIEAGNVYLDGPGLWDEHQPTEVEKNRYVGRHGLAAYGNWHLGIDDEENERSRRRFLFPCGDFLNVHRCAVLAVEEEASAAGLRDIGIAAAELREMLELLRHEYELEHEKSR